MLLSATMDDKNESNFCKLYGVLVGESVLRLFLEVNKESGDKRWNIIINSEIKPIESNIEEINIRNFFESSPYVTDSKEELDKD